MRSITIGFYGMTHLGLVSAIATASKGFNVIGFDQDTNLIGRLQRQALPIEEPGLLELVRQNAQRLSFSANVNDLFAADLIYVAIDVPTDSNNHSNLEPIRYALEHLRGGLQNEQTIVVLSQVCPGFMRAMQFPAQQLFYQVETLIFGRAVERATQPERFIVGCADTGKALPTIFQEVLNSFDCPILTMRYESAELAKISINMYLVSSVMTSNLLAELATEVGANWQEVVPTLRLDKRIGEYAYLNPGLGIAGGNLERDMATILKLGKQHSTNTTIVQTWLDYSRYCRDWVWRCLQAQVFGKVAKPRICILGLAYKPNTHSTKNSQSLFLLSQLDGYTLYLHDPIVKLEHAGMKLSVAEAISDANVIIVMTACEEYKKLTAAEIGNSMVEVVIDPHRALQFDSAELKFNYFSLGDQPIIKEKDYV
ncbi:MAG: nucleotide sugar dehydrogenase [Gammaproteobacteria bacterium]|nr:nucleotide sugar dehydrogenase [Gammaproteobacteria bacterium]